MTIITKINTWSCDTCQYRQDFDPNDIKHEQIHVGIKKNTCPSCKTGKMKKETDVTKLITHNTITDAEINDLDLTLQEKADLKLKRNADLAKTNLLKHI